jgi:hypothetical protein
MVQYRTRGHSANSATVETKQVCTAATLFSSGGTKPLTEDRGMTMCCLVRTTAHLERRCRMSKDLAGWWFSRSKPKNSDRNQLQGQFIHNETHLNSPRTEHLPELKTAVMVQLALPLLIRDVKCSHFCSKVVYPRQCSCWLSKKLLGYTLKWATTASFHTVSSSN